MADKRETSHPSIKSFSMKFRLMTLLVVVAFLAGIFSVVRISLYPPVPSTSVHGRVVYDTDGSPVSYAVVHAQMISRGRHAKVSGNRPTKRYSKVVADMSGRYTMPEMEAGAYNIWAESPPYTVVAV